MTHRHRLITDAELQDIVDCCWNPERHGVIVPGVHTDDEVRIGFTIDTMRALAEELLACRQAAALSDELDRIRDVLARGVATP